MSELTQIEREAKLVRDFITELKGLTPKFNAAKERAETELALHLAKIDGERAKLKELIDAAALIVQRLGIDTPAEQPAAPGTGPEQGDMAEAFAAEFEADEEPERVVAMADSPQDDEQAKPEPESDAPTFQTIGEIAAEITAGVAAMAGDQPAAADLSDAPEMTDEQVERAEDTLAAAEPARHLRRFNALAANPFA
jgi:hypothetical protein